VAPALNDCLTTLTDANESLLPAEAVAFLHEWLGDDWRVEPLRGDASVRAYYRIVGPGGERYMLAYYPEPVRPQLQRFLGAYDAIREHSRIPAVLRHSPFAVAQHDVGDKTLLDVLREDHAEGIRYYRQAIELLVAFQQSPGTELNPAFTAEFFLGELEMTREFYVEKLLGVTNNEQLISSFVSLSENVSEHPYVLCHRDYHGENLHLFDGTLFMIDYQDLRLGPDTYDLASLLRDRGVARLLGEETERELIAFYRELGGFDDRLEHRYYETLLQRSIKILGTFAKQAVTRGRLHYLEFIPPTLESIRVCLSQLPEYSVLASLFPMSFSLDDAVASLTGTTNL
jgi:aminoglycoside/choline kinase family phosphotransferase